MKSTNFYFATSSPNFRKGISLDKKNEAILPSETLLFGPPTTGPWAGTAGWGRHGEGQRWRNWSLTAVDPFFTASWAYSTWKRCPSGEKTVIARSYRDAMAQAYASSCGANDATARQTSGKCLGCCHVPPGSACPGLWMPPGSAHGARGDALWQRRRPRPGCCSEVPVWAACAWLLLWDGGVPLLPLVLGAHFPVFPLRCCPRGGVKSLRL